MSLTWIDWRGSFDGRPTMLIIKRFDFAGWRIELHAFIGRDDPGCFHTHPAHALRFILCRGYIEQMESGELKAWRAGDIGIVRPKLSHRVADLLGTGPCYTLWIRTPKRHQVELRGPGWPPEADR